MKKYYLLLKYCLKEIIDIYAFWYNSKKNTNEQLFTYLRTACHILDKGLNAIPFEKGHSKGIYERAKSLNRLLKTEYGEDPSYLWTSSILEKYEQAQKIDVIKNVELQITEYNDLQRKIFFDFMRSRVSCRNYIKCSVSEHVLKEIVELAVDAPNGCCRQTVRYYISQDSKKIKSLVGDIAGITCFSEIPCLVFVTSFNSVYSLRDRNLQYVDASLSIENFVLAARAYNIFTTICNFFHANRKQVKHVKSIMQIPSDENIIAVITMGYSNNVPMKPVRMSANRFYKVV